MNCGKLAVKTFLSPIIHYPSHLAVRNKTKLDSTTGSHDDDDDGTLNITIFTQEIFISLFAIYYTGITVCYHFTVS
jgi:hypothetical protein